MTNEESPLVCNMGAMDGPEAERHRHVTHKLQEAIEDFEEIGGGYRLRLPAEPGAIELTAEFLARERLCCPFLSFRLHAPAGASSIEFEISGPPGTPELLRGALELA